MASLADAVGARGARDDRFFVWAAWLIALVIVSGFSVHLAMGRSSFAAPLVVHAHAVVFMGWVAIYVTQATLASNGALGLHRRLGWIGAAWVPAMVVLGCAVTVHAVQYLRTPFFFQPAHFLVGNPATLFAFAGLTAAAVAMRRRTDWHRRLHLCGTAMILGPGFGRLLPMPLMQPWGFEAAVLAGLLFPAAGMVADARRRGRVHPAYRWGMGVAALTLAVIELVGRGPIGLAIHAWVVAGTPGAGVPGMAFGTPPV